MSKTILTFFVILAALDWATGQAKSQTTDFYDSYGNRVGSAVTMAPPMQLTFPQVPIPPGAPGSATYGQQRIHIPDGPYGRANSYVPRY